MIKRHGSHKYDDNIEANLTLKKEDFDGFDDINHLDVEDFFGDQNLTLINLLEKLNMLLLYLCDYLCCFIILKKNYKVYYKILKIHISYYVFFFYEDY